MLTWRPIGIGNGGTQARPYLRKVLWSQIRKAAISSPGFAAFTMACTKSW